MHSERIAKDCNMMNKKSFFRPSDQSNLAISYPPVEEGLIWALQCSVYHHHHNIEQSHITDFLIFLLDIIINVSETNILWHFNLQKIY